MHCMLLACCLPPRARLGRGMQGDDVFDFCILCGGATHIHMRRGDGTGRRRSPA